MVLVRKLRDGQQLIRSLIAKNKELQTAANTAKEDMAKDVIVSEVIGTTKEDKSVTADLISDKYKVKYREIQKSMFIQQVYVYYYQVYLSRPC